MRLESMNILEGTREKICWQEWLKEDGESEMESKFTKFSAQIFNHCGLVFSCNSGLTLEHNPMVIITIAIALTQNHNHNHNNSHTSIH